MNMRLPATRVVVPKNNFPYLSCKLEIERPNQVWGTDITYTAIVEHRAFVIGIVNWFSRKSQNEFTHHA